MATVNDELNRLFRAYREACPDPEPSADFMPGVWRKIEARRGFTLSLRRWTSAFVAASAALCVAMAVYMGTLSSAESALLTTTYLEALDNNNLETLAYTHSLPPEAFPQPEAQ